MAKHRRKPSASQRSKFTIDVAKYLKQAGIISKKANLHSGRYVSRGVLAKVRKHITSARLGYRAVKVPVKVAQAAKERGFQTIGGNKIIGPNEPRFRNRLKKGLLTGVVPVKGGMIEEVDLPHSIMDMQTLVETLGNGISDLKMPNEQFAFRYYGHHSLGVFRDSQHLLSRLQEYYSIFSQSGELRSQDMTEEFQNLVILRVHREDADTYFPGGPDRRPKPKRKRVTRSGRSGNDYNPDRAEYVRNKQARYAKKRRDAMTAKQREAYNEKSRIRAARSTQNRRDRT